MQLFTKIPKQFSNKAIYKILSLKNFIFEKPPKFSLIPLGTPPPTKKKKKKKKKKKYNK
jgi:hypothetical protein